MELIIGKYQDSKKTFECEVCSKEFGWQRTLNIHRIIHHDQTPSNLGPVPISMKDCDQTPKFLKNSRLQKPNHSNKAQGEVCDICDKFYGNIQILNRHKKTIHYKVFDVVCHLCARQFSQKQHLERHLVALHNIGERKHKCDQCDRAFLTKNNLDIHYEANHKRSEAHQCPECPKIFWARDYLKTHIRNVHKKHRPHKCDICDKRFLSGRDVVRHKKVHHKIV